MSDEKPGRQRVEGSYVAQADRGSTAIVTVFQAASPRQVDPSELTRALELVDSLPINEIPAPAGLPAGSWMPLRRNALFVGREEDLRALGGFLKTGGAAAVGQSTAVTGLGGIGKTQLACEFVWRYGRFFAGGVFWLSFADPDAVPTEVASCGGPRGLNLHDAFSSLPLDARVGQVASAWQSDLPRLLVFDNCEDESLLRDWLPRGGGCRVLVTSRRSSWSRSLGVRSVPLGVLSRAESRELVQGHRSDLGPDELDPIAEELGDLPLALHLAGSYLARYRHTPQGNPDAYLKTLRTPGLLEHRSLTLGGESPTGHEEHVARTFAISVGCLDPADPVDEMALAILARAAWFAPGEAIPHFLLRATLEGEGETVDLAFADGLQRLVDGGLVDLGEAGETRVHRLVVAFARGVLAGDEEPRDAVEGTVLREASRINDSGFPGQLLVWQPHLRAISELAETSSRPRADDLLRVLGTHLYDVADYVGARTAFQRALDIDEEALGPDNFLLAAHLNNLAVVLNKLADSAGARIAYERALAINEKAWGPDSSLVAGSLRAYGSFLCDLGDFAGARVACERSLSILETKYGPDHESVATSVNGLGAVLRELGDYAGARAAFERSLVIEERLRGPSHPTVAIRLNNLGSVLRDLGDFAGARAVFERALKISETAFGPEHPKVAAMINNLGSALRGLGDSAGARAAFERALHINEKVFGPGHPDVAIDLNNLGAVLRDFGELSGARAAHERALAICEEALGSSHPEVARSVNSLGLVHKAQGDLLGARLAIERALAIRERVFGPEHPEVAISLTSLGEVLQDLGDQSGARETHRRAFVIFEAKLGREHPTTRSVREKLDSLTSN